MPSGTTAAAPGSVTYQEGDGKGSVSEGHDAKIQEGSPTSNFGSTTDMVIDASAHEHSVIKFPNIFGVGANQIPLGSVITNATLTVEMFDPGDDVLVYQLIEGWVESEVTWNEASTGVSWTNLGADGVGSRKATAVGTLLAPSGSNNVDVTASVQNWAFGEINEGWLLKDTGSGGVDIRTSEYGTLSERPMLSVTYVPNSGGPTVAAAIPDTTVIENSSPVDNYRDLKAVFTDVEEGSQLTFTIQSNTNPVLITPTIGADSALDLSFTASTTGTATITIRASDSGALFVDDVFIVTVDPAAPAALLARYWMEEAWSGQAPTQLIDDQASPLNIPIHGANYTYTALATGRGWTSTTIDNQGRATTLVDGTKIQTTLDGATAATIEVVLAIDALNASMSLSVDLPHWRWLRVRLLYPFVPRRQYTQLLYARGDSQRPMGPRIRWNSSGIPFGLRLLGADGRGPSAAVQERHAPNVDRWGGTAAERDAQRPQWQVLRHCEP